MPTVVALTTTSAPADVVERADPGTRAEIGDGGRPTRGPVDDHHVGGAGAAECVDQAAGCRAGAEDHQLCAVDGDAGLVQRGHEPVAIGAVADEVVAVASNRVDR